MAYVAQFGAAQRGDLLYEAVSEGRRYPGMEHWLPLFHDGLDTLFDYAPGSPIVMEAQGGEAAASRLDQIADYYDARKHGMEHGGGAPYKPLPPETLYLTAEEWERRRGEAANIALSGFALPESKDVIDLDGHAARSFAPERADPEAPLFDIAAEYLRDLARKKRTILAALVGRLARPPRHRALRSRTEGHADHRLARCGGSSPEGHDRPRRARHRERLRDRRAGAHRRAGHPRRPPGPPQAQGAPAAGRHRRTDLAHRRRPRGACRSRHRPLHRPEDHRGDGRAARLPRDPLCGRLQALPAGGEPRTALALRLGGHRGAARPAGRRRLAGAQGADEEPDPRDGGRADQDRRAAPASRGAAPRAGGGAL